MSNELPHYPALLQREGAIMFELMGSTLGGGQTASGVMPLARLDGGGLWKASLSDIPLVTADQVRAWRALAAICDGGVQPVVVSMCDKRQFPAPIVSGDLLYSNDDVPHSDDAPFSDLSEYTSDVVSATLADDAALRDTSITIDIAAGGDLNGGEHFSIDHADLRWRLYRIATARDNGDGTWDCTIRPPLRAAVVTGTALQFDHPKCVMRLASPSSMDLKLSMRKFGQPSVEFVEAFPPFPDLPAAATPPPSWVPTADGVVASVYAEFSTEGGFNHYWYNDTEYSTAAAWLTALAGTFTGSANGTYTNAAGLVAQAVLNTPRFDYNASTLAAKGLLLEGARTNVVLWSRDLTNAAWTKSNITAAKNQIGADGVTNSASSLTATAGNGTCLQAIVLGSSARYQSAYVKRLTGSGTINMTMDNGATWTPITVTSSWTPLEIPTQTLANPTVGFRIVTSGDAIAVDYVQNENGTFRSSAIPTTTVAVARAADLPSLSSAALSVAAGTAIVKTIDTANVQSARLLGTNAGSAALQNNTGKADLYNGSVAVDGGSALTWANQNICGSSWDGTGISVTSNGSSPGTSSNTNALGAAYATLGIGHDGSGGNSLFGHITSMAIWTFRASDAELQRLTTP